MPKHLPLVLALAASSVQAQNLVPNDGFETLVQEPCGYLYYGVDINDYVADWHSPTAGSPDYFTSTNSCFPIPNTQEGPATAHSGERMAGLIHFSYSPAMGDATCPGEGTEYLQVPLTQPLIPGQLYGLQCWLRLSDNSEYACDHLAFAFTDTALTELSNVCPFPVTADITLLSHIQNVWTPVDTTFVAASAANYLTIGRFSPAAQVTCVPSTTGTGWDRSYYFIDDVSVYQIQGPTAVIEPATPEVRLLSNLVNDQLVVIANGAIDPGSTIEIHSTAGQLVLRDRSRDAADRLHLDVSGLASGRYVFRIVSGQAVTNLPFVKVQ